MGLEAANFIAELDQSWPTGLDPVNKGDDHLRLLKQVLKDQFPGVGGDGYAETILALEDDLNNTTGSTSNFQDQIDALVAALDATNTERSPIGGIIMYNGTFANIPANWNICDGSNGTPNLTNRFVYGTVTEGEIGDTGGSSDAVVVSHNHSGSTGNQSTSHNHNITTNTNESGSPPSIIAGAQGGGTAGQSSTLNNNQSHSHSVTVNTNGVSGTDKNIPRYLKLAYIQRIS